MNKIHVGNIETATLPEAASYAAFVVASHHGIDKNRYEIQSGRDLQWYLEEMAKDLRASTKMVKRLAARMKVLLDAETVEACEEVASEDRKMRIINNNFLGIESATIPLPDKPVLVVGPNVPGKTVV